MLDRKIGMAGPKPESAAHIPAAGEAQIERERTVDQPDHGTDVLAEIRQYVGGVGEDAGVVLPRLERLPREIGSLAAGYLWLFGPTFGHESPVTERRPGKRRPVMPVDHDCLFEQSQSIESPFSCYWK